MKISKNKIVFSSVLLVVLLFLCGYSYLIFSGKDSENNSLKQTLVPALEQQQEDYTSKLDAINDLREVRETNAPSIYDEKLMDSAGYYDPNLEKKNKERIVDSIYSAGKINYDSREFRTSPSAKSLKENRSKKLVDKKDFDFSRAHQEFFNYYPKSNNLDNTAASRNTDAFLLVEVNGEQSVKTDSRIELRLTSDALVNGDFISRNSLIYGFVRFKANRVLITITNINNKPVDLKAFDLLDGNEGIYVTNSFTADATREVLDDMVQNINIPGVPQVGGIKQVFRRNNRNVKVTVHNQYQLILKPTI